MSTILNLSEISISVFFLIFKNFTFKTIQWKPFNVIPLVQVQTDNINKMIITTNLLYF
jgi:hypothetical protein